MTQGDVKSAFLMIGLQGHKGPITGLATTALNERRWLLVSTAGDGDVVVWESTGSVEEETADVRFDEVQRICMDFQMQNAVAITQLPGLDWCVFSFSSRELRSICPSLCV